MVVSAGVTHGLKHGVKYVALLQEVSTGEVREIPGYREWDYTEYYQWVEGNYSCDCNRHMFFHDLEVNQADCPCGDDVAYRLMGFREVVDGD